MKTLEFMTIAQGALDIMNPVAPERILAMGRAAGLNSASRVIEYGCGNGTILGLWAQNFGISGIGLEIRDESCESAREHLAAIKGANDVEVRCMDATAYDGEGCVFDLAACIGATDIFGGFEPTLTALKKVLAPGAKMLIGERYWKEERVPPEFAQAWPDIRTEFDMLQSIRGAGFELARVSRATPDEWDAYESGIWQNCLSWLHENPGDPDYDEVAAYIHTIQEEYLGFGREYIGWAIYLLTPRPGSGLQ
jgi:SAM-dependent methyltransferase